MERQRYGGEADQETDGFASQHCMEVVEHGLEDHIFPELLEVNVENRDENMGHAFHVGMRTGIRPVTVRNGPRSCGRSDGDSESQAAPWFIYCLTKGQGTPCQSGPQRALYRWCQIGTSKM